jgi:osmotically-inducible protein OsmY
MRKRLFAILGILAVAALAVACGESDATITTKVKTKIATDRSITSASQIEVSTQRKVVTLAGTAENGVARERAVALARGTEGVVDVIDNLRVTPQAQAQAQATQVNPATGVGEKISEATGEIAGTVDDVAITTAVKTKLLADTKVSGTKIDVDTKGGVVTLTGTVKSEAEKVKAIQIARDTKGVQRVEDQLMVHAS